MPPSNPLLILADGVLEIVNQYVDSVAEVVARCPLGGPRRIAAETWLVIRQISNGLVSVGDPKAERRTWMANQIGRDLAVADFIGAGSQVVEPERREVAKPHREQGR